MKALFFTATALAINWTGCYGASQKDMDEKPVSNNEMKKENQSDPLGNEVLRYLWELRRCFEGQEIIEKAPASILFEQGTCSNRETAMGVDASLGPNEWPSPILHAEGLIVIWVDRHGQYWAQYSNKKDVRQFWDGSVEFDIERTKGNKGYTGYPSGMMIFYQARGSKKQIVAILTLMEWEQISWFSGWPRNAFITRDSSLKVRAALEKKKCVISDGVLKMEASPEPGTT
jgi:hypothetical protein